MIYYIIDKYNINIMLICNVKNISKKISSRDFFSKNDLFVCIECNGKKHRTITIWDNNKPEWNTFFIFNNTVDNKAVLTCYLYDEDKYGKNEIIKKESIVVNETFNGSCAGVNIECFFGIIKKNTDVNDDNEKINSLLLENNKLNSDYNKLNEDNKKLNNDNKKLSEQNKVLRRDLDNKNEKIDDIKNKCNNIIKMINN